MDSPAAEAIPAVPVHLDRKDRSELPACSAPKETLVTPELKANEEIVVCPARPVATVCQVWMECLVSKVKTVFPAATALTVDPVSQVSRALPVRAAWTANPDVPASPVLLEKAASIRSVAKVHLVNLALRDDLALPVTLVCPV